MKKWLSILLSISMLASFIPSTVFASENKFSDVTGSEYYAKAADELSALKVIEGYTDGTFSADKPITRAEMAAIVCRAIDKEVEEKNTKTNFLDVQAEHWASSYIQAAAEEKIINGYGDGKFCPEANVKYEEALKMVVCALGYGEEVQIDEKDWSAGYIEVAKNKGITENLTGSKGTAATRGDVAVMIHDGLTADLAAPSISLAAGEYTGTQKVTLSTTTKDAQIYYTVDGTEPNAGSTKYVNEISISKTSTLKAVTVMDEVLTSDVTSAEYTIKAVARSGGGGSSSSSKKYTVTFDLNYEGATDAPEKQIVKRGNEVTEPETPTREGFIFIGWSTSADEESLFDFSEGITRSITLYALWAAANGDDTYSVTFILNDGTTGAYEMQIVPAYGYATRPTDPERELYEFTGWYTEAEMLNEYDFSTQVTSDTTLYAGWGAPGGGTGAYAASSGGGTEYSITGIEMVDNQVSVTINANESSVLVVKFLDEETEEVITTVSTQTPSYCELVPVLMPVEEELPEHYLIIADLYDNDSNKLCDSFRCIKYTSDYEQFDAQTINDFDEDRVVNFDDDESNNFGVFSENVKRIDSTDEYNTLTVENYEIESTDEEQLIADKTYIFENADENVLNLSVGDSVYINGTSYLFKIASIEIEDGKVILTESDDVELKDFYDVLKVDMEIKPEQSGESDAELMWDPVDVETSFQIGGDINWKPKDWLEVTGGLNGKGTIKVEIIYDVKLFQDDYFNISVISSLEFNVNVGVKFVADNDEAVQDATKDVTEIVLAKIGIPTPVPGLTIELKPSIPLELEFKGGVEFEFNGKMETGFIYDSYTGKQNVDKKERTVKIHAEAEGSAKLGPKFKIAVEFCKGVVSAGINAGAGVKATAETSIGYENTTAESKHDCTLCINGTIKWYAEVYADASYKIIDEILEGEIGKWYIVNIEGNFPISPNFYISLINSEDSVLGGNIKFGFGDCPNESYRTIIIAKDSDGNEIEGINVSINRQNGNTSKSGSSPFRVYLNNGNYTASATIENENVSKSIVVSGSAQEIELTAESNDGSVYGMVCDAENNDPISGANIIISQNGTIVTTATSGSDGSYQVDLGDGTFSIETTKEGYIPFDEYVTISNAATTYLQTTKLVPGDGEAKGGFSGQIVNNVNGEPIEGVTLKLRKGWNNKTEGEVIETLTTDENGDFLYEIKKLFGVPVKLDVGNYTLVATKEGFATTSHNVIVRPGVITSGQDFSMSPSLADGKYRIRLSWGLNPHDLDSHLVGPTSNGGNFHTWYMEKQYYANGELVADLDLDDTTSYGPETTTIHEVEEGKYYFFVHHYSGSGSIATSGAQVEVYKGDEIIATYNAPLNQGNGLYWNVFILDTIEDKIIPVNTITDSPDTDLSLYSEDYDSYDEVLALIAEDIANAPKE